MQKSGLWLTVPRNLNTYWCSDLHMHIMLLRIHTTSMLPLCNWIILLKSIGFPGMQMSCFFITYHNLSTVYACLCMYFMKIIWWLSPYKSWKSSAIKSLLIPDPEERLPIWASQKISVASFDHQYYNGSQGSNCIQEQCFSIKVP